MITDQHKIRELFRWWAQTEAGEITFLPASGSYRKYYRIQTDLKPVIGVINEDIKENEAFLSFTNHFLSQELRVPEIFAVDGSRQVFLLTDLGDETLFSFLSGIRSSADDFPQAAMDIYRKVIGCLPRFQVTAGKDLDYTKCYPRKVFDGQSMMWDLNYFKYYFLKLSRVPFDEQKLEDDFNQLVRFLLSAGNDHFMYRDFQSRNIMLVNNDPWFIDYQGGRKGPLQYDIASLLYDAKASVPEPVRQELLGYYLDVLSEYVPVERKTFHQYYYGFVLIRILQALGAYGFRGYYENKPHFLQSIPYATGNLEYLLKNKLFPLQLPMLYQVLEGIVGNPEFRHYQAPENQLKVTITSFSYRSGIPEDKTGNGGGFVFDCRALPNPGRFEEYKQVTGKDHKVMEFLKKEHEVDEFLNHAFSLVDQSVKRYIERGFINLEVSFGCTGGQHRSVYCAEELARHLKTKFAIDIQLMHTEIRK